MTPSVPPSSTLITIVTFVYFGALVLYWAGWIYASPRLAGAGRVAAVAGLLGNTASFFLRWVESYRMGAGHVPLSNLYESLVIFAIICVATLVVIEVRYKLNYLGALVTPLAFFALAYAALQSSEIRPLIPALQSNWLHAHVFTAFLGYAAFAVALGLAVMYLLKKRSPDGSITSSLPEAGVLDQLMYQSVLLGFLFLTVGIITGAVWANSAWGRYWSWDPKETWSLITWFIYASLIHVRLVKGWAGTRTAVISIVGFAAVLFTWFGVNYLSGLHAYG
ncbi:MAG: c-type cytochrome biogenesis protein CcsB [Deltaproteobacteria bacterium]|nr:c-type cytochrome biogenesis protein CcsB [Deltaproteobacteria bacterium]